jgi:NAD(P)-dependent dehydrogenase (short-subunit alcohol dehydrogenase family)
MGVSDLFDLTGKVAVVTGGSRGIGRSMIKGFAAAGADVVIASRKLDNCSALAKEIEAETGRNALPVACHVGHWDECDQLVETVYEQFGKCDVFVNNAGMSPLYPDLVSVTEELFDKVVGVNLKGPFRLGVLVGKRMYDAGSGSIINVSTIGSLLASVGELPYAAAKAGLNAFTVGLAEALAPKVRVNCILPGAFDTDITAPWPEEMKSGRMVPMKRLGDPDDMIGLALYLASEKASSYTTGALIRVDGGMTRKV